MKKTLLITVLSFVILLGISSYSYAVPYAFEIFTNNPTPLDLSLVNMQVDVTTNGSGQGVFTFNNYSGIQCTIGQIYFDDGVDGGLLASLSSISNGPGVSFHSGASPSNVPGWNTLTPNFSATFAFGADNPAPSNGVNETPAGEYVSFIFDLESGMGLGDITTAIDNGDLRMAMHIINFDDEDPATGREGSSQGALNKRTTTPEPTSLALLGIGLFGAGLFRKRR